MTNNAFTNFCSRLWGKTKSIAKSVWSYLKVAKMEWIVMIGLFALDLISKSLVERFLGFGKDLPIIPNFLSIHLIPNYNAAYGADFVSGLIGTMGARIFFSVFAVAASVAFILVLIRNKGRNRVFRIGIAMFVAGAMGNCIDRMYLGYVRDFVWFTFQSYIFNIADAELIFGVVLIVIYFVFLYKEGSKKKDEAAPLSDELGAVEPVDMTTPATDANADGNSEKDLQGSAEEASEQVNTDAQADDGGADT